MEHSDGESIFRWEFLTYNRLYIHISHYFNVERNRNSYGECFIIFHDSRNIFWDKHRKSGFVPDNVKQMIDRNLKLLAFI